MEQDHWGRDPAVREMRTVFAAMEQVQKDLLLSLKLSNFDGRLRAVREAALIFFEKAAARAAAQGMRLNDTAMVGIYTQCLEQALTTAGIEMPQDMPLQDQALRKRVREVSG